MNHKPAKTACRCGQPLRPGGRYCNSCHAEKQKLYRAEMKAAATVGAYAEAVIEFKKYLVMNAIKAEKGNFCAAAKSLGVHRNTVNLVLREVGLSSEHVRRYLRGEA